MQLITLYEAPDHRSNSGSLCGMQHLSIQNLADSAVANTKGRRLTTTGGRAMLQSNGI